MYRTLRRKTTGAGSTTRTSDAASVGKRSLTDSVRIQAKSSTNLGVAPSRQVVNEPDVEADKGVEDDLEEGADDGGDEDAEDGAPEIDGNPAAANDVQLKGDASGGDAAVHDAAAQGLSGSSSSLPHLDRIQQSFGPQHDVSGVQAHVGGAAADACDAIGASAYASGEATAFKSNPDLHTAAHEAAHVVQQKQGVSLYGGVGRAGDVHEQHADAVADRVVAGESAADLLGASPGGGASSNAVQRKDGPEAHVPNNTYEVKVVIKEFNRVSIDARMTIAHTNSKLATGSQDVAPVRATTRPRPSGRSSTTSDRSSARVVSGARSSRPRSARSSSATRTSTSRGSPR